MNRLPNLPKYVRRNNIDIETYPISSETAIINGNYLFSKIEPWLKNDGTYKTVIPPLNPPSGWSMPIPIIRSIVTYFNTPERKEWLGRQFNMLQGGNAPLSEHSPVNMDDIPLFFNWLFRIPSYKIPIKDESPLLFENNTLTIQSGGRRRHTQRRRKNRKTRQRK